MEESVTCRGPCKKTWAKFGRSSFLRHIKQATKCKEKYTDNEIIDLEHASEERVRNMKKRRHQNTYNLEERQAKYIKDKPKIQAKYIQDKQNNKKSSTEESRLQNFCNEKKYGPIFTCICCMRNHFKRSVKKITDNYMLFLHGSEMIQFLQMNNPCDGNDLNNILKESLKVFGNHYLCQTCSRSLVKLEMPPMCAKNGLEYTPIPICLQIANLERQLICKDLTFLKVRELRPTRMSAMNDRVINVAISDDDIIKTVSNLPRTEKNNGMVTLGLKRNENLKTFHKLDMINPVKVYNALVYLKENNPQYKDINISDLDEWQKQFKEESDDGSNHDSSDEKEESEDDEEPEESIFTSTTCLLPENPLNDVIGKVLNIFVLANFKQYAYIVFPF